jgi:hypothetical protein
MTWHNVLVVTITVILCLLLAVLIHGVLPRPDGRAGWIWPVSPTVAQYPCKCGHAMAEHVLSPDMSELEPCLICDRCPDFWADFESKEN